MGGHVWPLKLSWCFIPVETKVGKCQEPKNRILRGSDLQSLAMSFQVG